MTDPETPAPDPTPETAQPAPNTPGLAGGRMGGAQSGYGLGQTGDTADDTGSAGPEDAWQRQERHGGTRSTGNATAGSSALVDDTAPDPSTGG